MARFWKLLSLSERACIVLYSLESTVSTVFWRKLWSPWYIFGCLNSFISDAASRVISDQTELRLLEQTSRRTETLIHTWGCRNGTVGELVKVLEDLRWYRARDVIVERMSVLSHCLCHDFTTWIIKWFLWLLMKPTS